MVLISMVSKGIVGRVVLSKAKGRTIDVRKTPSVLQDSFKTSTFEHAWCGAPPQAIAETYDMGLYRDAFRGYRRVCRNDSDVVTNG